MFVAALLLLVVVAFRVVLGATQMNLHELTWLHNFSPLAAIALCGAVYLPRRVAFVFPLAALLLSDLLINARYGVALVTPEMLPRYGALGLIAGLGWMLRNTPRLGWMLAGSVAGSVMFFLVTNTGSWLAEPRYAKNVAGLIQALTTGLPGVHPTTLEFFRNTLVSDVVFTALFVGCMALQHWLARAATLREREPAPWC